MNMANVRRPDFILDVQVCYLLFESGLDMWCIAVSVLFFYVAD